MRSTMAEEVVHSLDMLAFAMAKKSVKVSDMLSALARAVKHGTLDEFEGKWLK